MALTRVTPGFSPSVDERGIAVIFGNVEGIDGFEKIEGIESLECVDSFDYIEQTLEDMS